MIGALIVQESPIIGSSPELCVICRSGVWSDVNIYRGIFNCLHKSALIFKLFNTCRALVNTVIKSSDMFFPMKLSIFTTLTAVVQEYLALAAIYFYFLTMPLSISTNQAVVLPEYLVWEVL